MENDKQKRISEINERVTDLKEHIIMWRNAGGIGKNMSINALIELKELELEKEDIINGTNKLQTFRLEKRLKQLKALNKEANFIKKIQYKSEIKKTEGKIKLLQNK